MAMQGNNPALHMDVTFYPDSGVALVHPDWMVFRRMTPAEADARGGEPVDRQTTNTMEEFRALEWGSCRWAQINAYDEGITLRCILYGKPARPISLMLECTMPIFKRRMMAFWRLWLRYKFHREISLTFSVVLTPAY